MNNESLIRLIAGIFVLTSILLAYFVNINWLSVAGFVGVMLVVSSVTGVCIMGNVINMINGRER